MNPGSPLFRTIQEFGREIHSTAKDFCDQHVKLATAREQFTVEI